MLFFHIKNEYCCPFLNYFLNFFLIPWKWSRASTGSKNDLCDTVYSDFQFLGVLFDPSYFGDELYDIDAAKKIWSIKDHLLSCLKICSALSVCSSICISSRPSVYLSICPSIYLFVHPSICLSICPSMYVHPSICLSIRPSIHLSIRLSVSFRLSFSIRSFNRLSGAA